MWPEKEAPLHFLLGTDYPTELLPKLMVLSFLNSLACRTAPQNKLQRSLRNKVSKVGNAICVEKSSSQSSSMTSEAVRNEVSVTDKRKRQMTLCLLIKVVKGQASGKAQTRF